MSSHQATNPFDLLGQAPAEVFPVKLRGEAAPALEIGWGEFHQGIGSSIAAILRGPRASRNFLSASFFKDCWIERRIPRRAVIAAALWHIAFLIFPLPQFSAPRHNPAFDNSELTWSGPIDDLPLVHLAGEKPRPSPRGEPNKPLPREGADAFHPRQRIFTDPSRPTHTRQTLINSAAPPEAPKLLPALPNVVQLAQVQAPPRPHIQIDADTLRKLHPRERRSAPVTVAPAPTIQNTEQRPADLNLAMQPNQPARPKLELNAAAAPLAAKRRDEGAAAPAPDVAPAQSAANGAPSTFIALSAAPAPPAPVLPPQGNLAARVSISPEGKQHGVPGGSPTGSLEAKGAAGANASSNGGSAGGNGAARDSIGVSITGGNPRPGNTMSGLGGKPALTLPPSRPTYSPRDSEPVDPPPTRTGPPNFADLPPGAKPEQIFGPKRVYTMRVDMPNLNSATGSWILHFSELGANAPGPHLSGGDVDGPEPIRKVDPKYPQTLMDAHVEGDVVLYAVIRRDGSVDSIQLVHGIDEQLDENAMHALGQWKFRPATRQGEAVDLEAIVHIPFRAPSYR
jgi:TonB family protein